MKIFINIVLYLGHILQDYAKDDMKKLMDKIDKFCTGLWRERVFQVSIKLHVNYIL
jgi:hypothetical protein